MPECDPAVCVLPACYCSADGTQAPGVTEDGSGLDIKQVIDMLNFFKLTFNNRIIN